MIIVTNDEGRPGVGRTAEFLAKGASRLDAIEAGIRLVEADPTIRTVGRGGLANMVGRVQLDAMIMDGDTLESGAVGAIEGFAHAITIARAVKDRLPHELLVGAGAERFAREIGAERADNLTDASAEIWQDWLEATVPILDRARWQDSAALAPYVRNAIKADLLPSDDDITAPVDDDRPQGADTTVFLAIDHTGALGCGVSTSGWAWKYPGRLGDSPIVGAGAYADSRYGAAACTGTGEMAIRAGTSRSIVLYLKMGLSLNEAVDAAIDDLRGLKGGLIDRITIHAIDAAGASHVVAVNAQQDRQFWQWRDGEAKPRRVQAEREDL